MLRAIPNILGDNKEQPILYKTDVNSYFSIEPRWDKIENVYLMESMINLEDNIWDFLQWTDQSEVEMSLVEVHEKQ